MSDTCIENQLGVATRKLNRRIVMQEEELLEREKAEKSLQDSEKSLRDSEKRYRRLFESAQDGILILDADTGARWLMSILS